MTVTTLNIPSGVPSDGNVRVDFFPSGAFEDYTEATLAELTDAAAEMIGVHMFGLGQGATTDRKEKRRLSSKVKYELLGSTTYTIEDLTYVYDVQNPESETNAAYAALTPHTEGFLAVRWGIDAATGLEAGQVVDILPVRLGAQIKQAPEENDELVVSQPVSVIGTPCIDYTIPAATTPPEG